MTDSNLVTMKAFNALLTQVQQMQDRLDTVQIPNSGPGQYQITLPDGSTSTDPYSIPGFSDVANQLTAMQMQLEAINSQMPAIPQLQLLQMLLSGGSGDMNQATALTTSQQLGDDMSLGLGGVPQMISANPAYKPPPTQVYAGYVSVFQTGTNKGSNATVYVLQSPVLKYISPSIASAFNGQSLTVPADGLYRVTANIGTTVLSQPNLYTITIDICLNGSLGATIHADSLGAVSAPATGTAPPALSFNVILSLTSGTTIGFMSKVLTTVAGSGTAGCQLFGDFCIERIYIN
jgi:hypothetical protein